VTQLEDESIALEVAHAELVSMQTVVQEPDSGQVPFKQALWCHVFDGNPLSRHAVRILVPGVSDVSPFDPQRGGDSADGFERGEPRFFHQEKVVRALAGRDVLGDFLDEKIPHDTRGGRHESRAGVLSGMGPFLPWASFQTLVGCHDTLGRRPRKQAMSVCCGFEVRMYAQGRVRILLPQFEVRQGRLDGLGDPPHRGQHAG
jgi:hypothetical protein